mmetsp:Transcript_22566/g.64930  ORF Transcript_22566/g.64930 Transcript_22566/m.64930 type:complete len:89 (+) Transcript_22566:1059-1325(+)
MPHFCSGQEEVQCLYFVLGQSKTTPFIAGSESVKRDCITRLGTYFYAFGQVAQRHRSVAKRAGFDFFLVTVRLAWTQPQQISLPQQAK